MSYLTRLHNRTIVPLALAIAFAIGCKGASAAEVTWVNGGTGYQSSGSGDWTTINNDATNPGLFPTLATESPTISNGNIVSLSGIGFNELPGAIVDPAAAPLVSDGAVLTILGTLRASGVFTYSGAAVELGLYQNDVVGAAVTGGGQLSLTGTIDVNGTPPAAGDGVGGIHLWSSTSILKLQNSSKITVANQGLNDTVGIAVKGSAATYAGDLSITTLPTSSAAAVEITVENAATGQHTIGIGTPTGSGIDIEIAGGYLDITSTNNSATVGNTAYGILSADSMTLGSSSTPLRGAFTADAKHTAVLFSAEGEMDLTLEDTTLDAAAVDGDAYAIYAKDDITADFTDVVITSNSTNGNSYAIFSDGTNNDEIHFSGADAEVKGEINLGAGNDELELDATNCDIQGKIDLGAGDDEASFIGKVVIRDGALELGAGDDVVTFTGSSAEIEEIAAVSGENEIHLLSDTVTLEKVTLGVGDDTMIFSGNTAEITDTFSLGDGDNVLTLGAETLFEKDLTSGSGEDFISITSKATFQGLIDLGTNTKDSFQVIGSGELVLEWMEENGETQILADPLLKVSQGEVLLDPASLSVPFPSLATLHPGNQGRDLILIDAGPNKLFYADGITRWSYADVIFLNVEGFFVKLEFNLTDDQSNLSVNISDNGASPQKYRDSNVSNPEAGVAILFTPPNKTGIARYLEETLTNSYLSAQEIDDVIQTVTPSQNFAASVVAGEMNNMMASQYRNRMLDLAKRNFRNSVVVASRAAQRSTTARGQGAQPPYYFRRPSTAMQQAPLNVPNCPTDYAMPAYGVAAQPAQTYPFFTPPVAPPVCKPLPKLGCLPMGGPAPAPALSPVASPAVGPAAGPASPCLTGPGLPVWEPCLGYDVWVGGYGGGMQQQKKGNNFLGFTSESNGVALGIDSSMLGCLTLGVGFSYSDNHILNDQVDLSVLGLSANSQSETQLDLYSLVLYGFYQRNYFFYTGTISGIWGNAEGKHFDNKVTYEASTTTLMAQLGVGYTLSYSPRLLITPLLNFNYYYFHQNGYDEEFDGAHIGSVASYNNGYCELDFIAATECYITEYLTFTLDLGYRHLFNSEGVTANYLMQGMSQQFPVVGISPAEDLFLCNVGGTINLSDVFRLQAAYNYRGGAHFDLNGWTTTLSLRF